MAEFTPARFIDRENEQNLFKEVLDPACSRRMLAIRGEPGAGKSQLLLRFRHHCSTTEPRIPVSLVELAPALERLALVERIATEMRRPFPTFTALRMARRAGEFEPFRQWINLNSANFANATNVRIANAMVEHANEVNVYAPSGLTEGQDALARELCAHAFFDDLISLAKQEAVVLILDSYEKVSTEDDADVPEVVESWLHYELLERMFEEPDPLNLVVVLAGREVPKFDLHWPEGKVEARVERRENFDGWTREHILLCLERHEFRHRPQDVDIFCGMVEMGATPQQLIQVMEINHRRMTEGRG